MKLSDYPDPENLYKYAKNTDALLKAEALTKGYEPPITLYMNKIQTQIEDNCLKAVQSYGFNVDKDELKKALEYDRNQYDKGYAAARKKYERPSGEWSNESKDSLLCSACGNRVYKPFIGGFPTERTSNYYPNFCAFCGADMRKTDLFNHCPNCGAYMRKEGEA